MKKMRMRILAALMVVLVLAATLPAAIAARSVQAIVASATMNVYRLKAPHRYLGTLPQGTMVTVKAYSGQAALISYNGRTGIVRASDLAVPDDPSLYATPTPAPTAAPTASPDELASARTMVTNRKTRVYRQARKSADYVSVKAGIKLSVLAVSGGVAKVASGSLVGYMPVSHLSDPGAVTVTPTPAPTQAPEVQRYDRIPVATTSNAKIYARPSTSSSSVSVDKGTRMVLLAVKGNCAMVERNDKVGYIARSLLTTDVAPVATATPAPAPTAPADDGETYTGSNEEVIFKFLTRVAGLNTAAACGIMANIKYESGYKATSRNASGSSIGICQWTGTRKTRLINWCKDNGYEQTSLKGQLYFLQYELKRYYPAVYNRLTAVPNTDQGAYDAGYDFCYNFEAPSSRASRSVTRGNYARTTLWTRYKT